MLVKIEIKLNNTNEVILNIKYKMENELKQPRRSVSLGSGSYSTEEINKIIIQTQKHADLLVYYIDYIRNYIDYIRNYRELTEEMMENIKKFDDNSKMLLIKEYNIVIKTVNSLFE